MKDFTFNVPQDIIFGKGSLKRLPELLEKSGSKKMLLISGPVLKKIGMVEKVEEIVKAFGIEVEVFTDVEANPSVATVDKATEAYKKAGATSIVAFGGGSPMDVAKADVYVDGKKVFLADPHENGWVHCNPKIICEEKESREHTVRIQIAPGDEHKKFTILGFGYVK